ncbi:unnamed protein product [Dovyalis caffra]|uniref:D-isomer specific 2-hydroxyacid dehydrogenase catalytic domain-containing protein n=1 Tax=Dovyalis caffra TaxID=77055 RepID=A0AAV1RJ73_9ROSI|nr:unnamed protein product [Dovyalis caffra]
MRALLCVDPAPISKDLLSLLPSLQIIVGSSVGVDHIDLTEYQLRGICVTNAGSAFCEDVADYVVGLLIDVLRRVSAADRLFRLGCGLLLMITRLVVMYSNLDKARVTLSYKYIDDLGLSFFKCKMINFKVIFNGQGGLGNINSEVAKRLGPFGCSMVYRSRKKKPSVTFPYYSDVRDPAANGDALILWCALTDETHHIVDKDVMAA